MTIEFEHIYNFRDMGDLKSADGRLVKRNLLFRSGNLALATNEDLVKLTEQLNVKTIFDYRDAGEIEAAPTPKLPNINQLNIPAITEDSPVQTGRSQETFLTHSTEQIKEDFRKFYALLPMNNPSYQQLIKEVASFNVPLLHHCTAGKDRTGVGAALIYLLLGVEEQQIMNEFLLTNEMNKRKPSPFVVNLIEKYGAHKQFDLLLGVDASFLQATFTAIIHTYGSYATYFEKEHHITDQKRKEIQAFYLQ